MNSVYQNLSRYRSELMGLAMLWVMLFHAYEFHFYVRPLDAFKAVGFAGVDVFILLSAMGLYVSLSKAPKGAKLSGFFLRRLSRILPAYWLAVGLYSLWLIQRGRIGWRTALWSLSTLHYWFRIPDTFNWYVPAILAFYLLAPFYVRLFRRCPWKEWLTAAMFPLSYGIYRLSIPLHLNYTEDFLCRIPAFALGILMGYYLMSDQALTRRHAAAWGALSLTGLTVTVLRLMNRLYISPCYLIAAQLVPLTLLAAWAMDRLPLPRVRGLLRLLGVSSLEIYLLNVIITREFAVLSPYLDYGPRHAFYYLVVYTGNLLLGVLLHRGLERLLPRRKLPGQEMAAASHTRASRREP